MLHDPTHTSVPRIGFEPGIRIPSVILAAVAAPLVVVALALASNRFEHWFVLPVIACGILAGTDAVDWLRGRLQPFDPRGLIGVYCTYALFLAPLLHIRWDYWMGEVAPPPDWRDWLGRMAILDALGLAAYKITLHMFSTRHGSTMPPRSMWHADRSASRLVIPAALAFTAALQAWIYLSMGGISGYIAAFHDDRAAFAGMGWLFMISEAFPIVLAYGSITYARSRGLTPNWLTMGFALVLLLVVQMFFGGLRGSRSNTVMNLIWVIGAIHFLIRPVSRRIAFAGVLAMIAFMYAYGFYKDGGDLNTVFRGEAERERVSGRTGRSDLRAVLLGDLGRADVQAYVLYKLVHDPADFRYAWGRTYVGSLSLLVPHFLLPNRPEGKLKEGTDLIYGPGTYSPDFWWSSRVYGLAGEAMMNFSFFAVPVAYALLGVVVGKLRSWIQSLAPGDLRFFLVPLAVLTCVSAISSDSDNLVFNTIKNSLVPTLVILISANRLKVVGASVSQACRPHYGSPTIASS